MAQHAGELLGRALSEERVAAEWSGIVAGQTAVAHEVALEVVPTPAVSDPELALRLASGLYS